jgi:type II secretory pathway component PulK
VARRKWSRGLVLCVVVMMVMTMVMTAGSESRAGTNHQQKGRED